MDEGPRWRSPPEIGQMLGVDPAKVRDWIEKGELRAVDLVAVRGRRPRYRVAPEWLEAFLAARQTVPAIKVVRRARTTFDRKYYT